VNASGQFCGLAEMVGTVDFVNDAEYWQQDRWSGQFKVKRHIVKDVPNSRFRHILENNTTNLSPHSRDSQEVFTYLSRSSLLMSVIRGGNFNPYSIWVLIYL
ncbi:YTH domain-containing protein, partial [Tanacetum coccineum]